MPLWRREPLHEKLAREGGLRPEPAGGEDRRAPWDKAGIHGVHRPREWDAVVVAGRADVEADRLPFVVLPDGTVVVDDDAPDADLGPLAEAVERELAPPYRAEAVRQADGGWAVAARRIEVLELPEHLEGDELELVVNEDGRQLTLDRERLAERVPELEQLAPATPDGYVVRATHLDGPVWEVTVSPL